MKSITIHTETNETSQLFKQLAARMGLSFRESFTEDEGKKVADNIHHRRRWAGSISKATGQKMLKQLKDSRNEWNRI